MSIFNKIFRGTVANDETGDPLRTGGQIVNDNFDIADAALLDRLLRVDSVEDIAGFVGDYDGQQISLLGWHPDSDIGGGVLYWDSSKAKSDHNGGTVFSPTVPWSLITGDYLDGIGETDGGGTGMWVRADVEYVTPEMFGAKSSGENDSASVSAAIKIGLVKGNNEYRVSDILIGNDVEIILSDSAKIKSIPEQLPDLATPSDIWNLTSKVFDIQNGVSFSLIGGSIDGSGNRPDGLPASSGPTSNTPDFGEYLIHAVGAKKVVIKSRIFNYLSDGAAGAPNGDVAIKVEDTSVVDFSGSEFYEIGNEVCYVTSSTDCIYKGDKVRAVGSRGSFNVYDIDKVDASYGYYENFSGSPLNLFSDNIDCHANRIKNVTNSHGIDFSEGLYRFSNQKCSYNLISDVNDNGVFGNGIDSNYSNNIIINCGAWGINSDNTIGGVEQGGLQIIDNQCIDCTSGGIALKGVAGVEYESVVRGNQLTQNSIIAGSIGLLLNNHSNVDINSNMISGYAVHHFKALSRINNCQFRNNKIKQPFGASSQTGDILLFDAQSDAFSLNDILISNNEFQAMPPPTKHTINFTGYSLEYGRFPNGTNMQVQDNSGVCLVKSDDNGVMYSATKGNARAGTTLQGRFNGGDLVSTRPTSSGQFSAYKILAESSFVNGVYTFRTAPTATISTTSGSFDATFSTANHDVQSGDSIRILDIDGVGGSFDTIVVERDINTGAVVLHDAPSNTSSGKSVQFLGTALNQGLPVSTL